MLYNIDEMEVNSREYICLPAVKLDNKRLEDPPLCESSTLINEENNQNMIINFNK